jgi:ribonuclease J
VKGSSKGELVMLPLGGAGEIGMNFTLYGWAGKWIAVDCGITFGDDTTPGIDVMVPDTSFIAERKKDLLGVVLTHAHEDHLGAVPYLWRKLGCPVYGTPFALGLLRRKLVEVELDRVVPLRTVPCGGGIELGPFRIDYIPAAHSIPEANVLAIRTPVGTVLHASDWKIDPGPLVGPCTDEAALRKLGEEGVIALVCDSTNAMVAGQSGSEAALRDSLIEVVRRCRQRVLVTCFASNVARLETIARAAEATGRNFGIAGRSIERIVDIARECGYLRDIAEPVRARDAGFLPRDRVILAVTGSQGEPQAMLSRIAGDGHPDLVLEAGDTVIFSAREIPGNERAVGRVQNLLARQQVRIITDRDAFVHVSGHPARDELAAMYEWVRPPLIVPIHGESRHLTEQLRYARQCGVPHGVIAENGSMLRLHPGPAEIVDHVPVGRFAVEGARLLPVDGDVVRSRRRLSFAGVAVATVVMDRKGRLRDSPRLTVPGLLDDSESDRDVHAAAVAAIEAAIEALSPEARRIDEEVIEAARRAVRRALREAFGRRPVAEIHIVRV